MDPNLEESNEGWHQMTRLSLFDIIKQSTSKQITKKFEYLKTHILNATKCPEEHMMLLKRNLAYFKCQFKSRWAAAHKKEDTFLKKNEDWLNGFVKFPARTINRIGRPKKQFRELSERSKRRKTKQIRTDNTVEELAFSAQMNLRRTGQVDASKVLKEITDTTPKRASKYRKAMASERKQLSPTEALSVLVEADLTMRQYEIIQKIDKEKFPRYALLQKEKKKCYPSPEAFRITSTIAELDLQSLMDHTAQRLCIYLEDVLQTLTSAEKENIQMISKWGCDGSQQSQYKQKFENTTDSDSNIFQSSLVYIQLHTNFKGKTKLIWQNPTPSSPRYCRPIRIRFIQECTDVIKEEKAYIENKINLMEKSIVQISSGTCYVEHKLLFTMIDGKICNAVTGTRYTLKCYICGLNSTVFNDLSLVQNTEINTDNLRFGLSILHARIRLFESILHLAYKLQIKKWHIKKGSEEMRIVDERKKIIQARFKSEMGLLVDFPKPGFGNSNDGNTSRRFFGNPDLAAEITGIDLRLIHRFKIILETLSSGFKIDPEKFTNYGLNTAQLYVELYPWHPMTPTMHKILMHGGVAISTAILPMGQLSEEAAEARNKYYKSYRQSFARKFSRVACNTDIVNRLLLRSDPVLTGLSPKPKKRTKPFSREAVELFLPPEILISSSDDDDSEEDVFVE